MEFNVYIKIFDKIKEFDVKSSYSIIRVKEYIVKFLKITFEFELYYNNIKLSNGTIMSHNIREDNTIILAPIMKTGKINQSTQSTQSNESNESNERMINFDSLDSVKEYLRKNFQENQEMNEDGEDSEDRIEDREDIEQNRKTMEKLQMLRQKYLKKN